MGIGQSQRISIARELYKDIGLSTVMKADNIVVMKAGHIGASGTFAELKTKSEYFNKLASWKGF